MINGRPQSINWADKYVPAILEAWYPGSQGGIAIAEILFGDYNPSGKLTVTFPKTVGQIPFNFPSKPGSQVDGGHGIGLKGNQSRAHGALYYFGHGLSYTSFDYKNLQLSSKKIGTNESLKVSFELTNSGDVGGTEIVQLYTRDLVSSVTTFEKNLRGFESIYLEAGETKMVEFTILPEHLELLNIDDEWVVEPGDFKIMIGASSVDIRLEDKFTVGESSNMLQREAIQVISDPISNSAKNVLDKNETTWWKGSKSNSITLSVSNLEKVGTLSVSFAEDSKIGSEFMIQLSSGGGQFLNEHTAKVDASRKFKLELNRSGVSDIRFLIESGEISISNMEIK